jgi:DNA-binding protein YbaB
VSDAQPDEAGWIQGARRGPAAALYTATDRRKVIRVTVDGAGGVHSIELTADWYRSLQSQSLPREVKTLYLAAREQAAEAAQAAYEDHDEPFIAEAGAALREFLGSVPQASDLMRQLETETVRTERARGGVAAEFSLRGELRELEIRPRYAADAVAERLASDIEEVLRESEGVVSARIAELAASLTGGRSLDEVLEDNVNLLRQRMEELKARLP